MPRDYCIRATAVLLALVCFELPLIIAGDSNANKLNGGELKPFVPASLARFELVLGRLQLSSEYFRIGAAHETVKLEDGRERTRSISISTFRGKPTMQFRDHGGEDETQLSFKPNRQADIVLVTGRDRDRRKFIYSQPAEGPIVVRVEFDDGRAPIECKACSLWHLTLSEPKFFEEYMQPCLSRLDPSWQFASSVAEAREIMSTSLHKNNIADEVKRLIEQLNSDRSADRHAALLQLESMGIAAEPILRRSLPTDLSSQQKSAITRLISASHPHGNDTPMRVAIWLAGDSSL